jgi:hypothetical protein
MKCGAIVNSRYREEPRGRFDSYLIDRRLGIAVAYTNCDVVKLTNLYREEDRTAVEEFAAQYDLPVDWEHRD